MDFFKFDENGENFGEIFRRVENYCCCYYCDLLFDKLDSKHILVIFVSNRGIFP